MIKITGFDGLSRTLEEASTALKDLDGQIGTVSFDPHDPASIEAAITEISRLVDEKMGDAASNPFVAQLTDGMKESYRQGILDKAAEARTESDDI
ncbi:hypothetical protein [Bradyrhizobium sp. Bra78]|uniref:hypothetical protein n=1 Tax=Bradyrhizobium sp. Bra78 TaxID=2926010 RepID=UPI0021C65526|nr:hypothetical protein [Bradyrhizobium sp. Bra78]